MRQLGYGIVDADNHYYEPPDCFTRYIEPAYRDRAVRPVAGEGGEGGAHIRVGDRRFTFLADRFPAEAERHAKPGSLREMLRNMAAARPGDDNPHLEPMQPAYVDRRARLALMDRQGVERTLVLPTLGVCVEHFMKDSPELTFANLRAFNRWLDDDWGFAFKGRIYAPPLLSLLDVDLAVAELERVLAAGARVIHLRPGPQAGRSPGHPDFDRFWARVDEAGVAVAFHISESGYNELFSVHWGQEANPSSHRQSAFQWTCFYGDRPIMETIASLIFDNFFGRFPNIRVVSIENGSLWVPYIMKAMDKMKGMGRNGPWPGGYVHGKPSEVFRQHVYVSPFHEEDIVGLVDLIGADRVVCGSDFPHAEGLAEPAEFADRLTGLDDASVRRIMRDNGLELLGAA